MRRVVSSEVDATSCGHVQGQHDVTPTAENEADCFPLHTHPLPAVIPSDVVMLALFRLSGGP